MSEAMVKEAGADFLFVGNLLCIDFVNTEVVQNGERVDLLRTFDDLVVWLRQAGALGEAAADAVRARWGTGRRAAAALEEALAFRAVLRAMVERMFAGEPVEAATLDSINELLASRSSFVRVERDDGGFRTRTQRVYEQPNHLLVPIAESARDLLCDGEPPRVKQCGGPNCILFFYDTSKNRARNWCSMSACGNRMKVAAHYRRKRSSNRS